MESLARESGVTRQTIHNLFGTKAEVLEALFDQLALDGGLDRMRNVMQQTDGSVILAAFVEVFTGFWAKDRMLIRRIHGIAAIDPEFGKGVEARNRRRQMAAGRVVARLNGTNSETDERERTHKAAELSALTSFEFFDALVEGCGSVEDAVSSILKLAKKALAPGS
jgi:AcrR family transcriptional regulator